MPPPAHPGGAGYHRSRERACSRSDGGRPGEAAESSTGSGSTAGRADGGEEEEDAEEGEEEAWGQATSKGGGCACCLFCDM